MSSAINSTSTSPVVSAPTSAAVSQATSPSHAQRIRRGQPDPPGVPPGAGLPPPFSGDTIGVIIRCRPVAELSTSPDSASAASESKSRPGLPRQQTVVVVGGSPGLPPRSGTKPKPLLKTASSSDLFQANSSATASTFVVAGQFSAANVYSSLAITMYPPLNQVQLKEKDKSQPIAGGTGPPSGTVTPPPDSTGSIRTVPFTYDAVLGGISPQGATNQNDSQSSLFQFCLPLIDSVLVGYNATIFAYGASGAGKTHTIEGEMTGRNAGAFSPDAASVDGSGKFSSSLPSSAGVLPRSLEYILCRVGALTESQGSLKTEYKVRATYIEIYNEDVFDLLELGNEVRTLGLGENFRNGSFFVKDARVVEIASMQDVIMAMKTGAKQKRMADTLLNAHSSRSHTIFTIYIEAQQWLDAERKASIKRVGKLNLVDLAGSERLSASKVEGIHLQESANINQSLFALSRCIKSLSAAQQHGQQSSPLPPSASPSPPPPAAAKDSSLSSSAPTAAAASTAAVSASPPRRDRAHKRSNSSQYLSPTHANLAAAAAHHNQLAASQPNSGHVSPRRSPSPSVVEGGAGVSAYMANHSRAASIAGSMNAVGTSNADMSTLSHIPWRTSKLTMLLKDSLGGNSYSLCFACLRPELQFYESTQSTLRFASLLKKIRNQPLINEDPRDQVLRKLQLENERLEKLVAELQAQQRAHGGAGPGQLLMGPQPRSPLAWMQGLPLQQLTMPTGTGEGGEDQQISIMYDHAQQHQHVSISPPVGSETTPSPRRQLLHQQQQQSDDGFTSTSSSSIPSPLSSLPSSNHSPVKSPKYGTHLPTASEESAGVTNIISIPIGQTITEDEPAGSDAANTNSNQGQGVRSPPPGAGSSFVSPRSQALPLSPGAVFQASSPVHPQEPAVTSPQVNSSQPSQQPTSPPLSPGSVTMTQHQQELQQEIQRLKQALAQSKMMLQANQMDVSGIEVAASASPVASNSGAGSISPRVAPPPQAVPVGLPSALSPQTSSPRSGGGVASPRNALSPRYAATAGISPLVSVSSAASGGVGSTVTSPRADATSTSLNSAGVGSAQQQRNVTVDIEDSRDTANIHTTPLLQHADRFAVPLRALPPTASALQQQLHQHLLQHYQSLNASRFNTDMSYRLASLEQAYASSTLAVAREQELRAQNALLRERMETMAQQQQLVTAYQQHLEAYPPHRRPGSSSVAGTPNTARTASGVNRPKSAAKSRGAPAVSAGKAPRHQRCSNVQCTTCLGSMPGAASAASCSPFQPHYQHATSNFHHWVATAAERSPIQAASQTFIEPQALAQRHQATMQRITNSLVREQVVKNQRVENVRQHAVPWVPDLDAQRNPGEQKETASFSALLLSPFR